MNDEKSIIDRQRIQKAHYEESKDLSITEVIYSGTVVQVGCGTRTVQPQDQAFDDFEQWGVGLKNCRLHRLHQAIKPSIPAGVHN